MKKGEIVELEITDYAFEGKGVAKIDGVDHNGQILANFVVFVRNAYPGDVVKAKIVKTKKSYAEANLIEVISPSSDRVKAKCGYFGICGGCRQQDLSYEAQLSYKENQVKEIFRRIGGISGVDFLPVVPSDNSYFYRNKMEFSFGAQRWLLEEEIEGGAEVIDKHFALGLHVPGVYQKVLDIDECYLQSELSYKIVNFTREFFSSRNVKPYSTVTHEGFLRNLIIRESNATKEIMINLVTFDYNERLLAEYKADLLKNFPKISTIVNNITKTKSQTAIGEYEIVLSGSGYITDCIGKKKYQISANSFFQTNTAQAVKLYSGILEFADFQGGEIVYDLYSGAGTIGIFISDYVSKVYGFESVESALSDGKKNIEINAVRNVTNIGADLNKSIKPILLEHNIDPPDIIITDPPRSGMHPKLTEDIAQLGAKKIVYVSCNPATQIRDIKELIQSGYIPSKSRPYDMFPQTYHIENIVLLEKI